MKTDTKKCCICKEDKNLSEFSKDKSREDGYTYQCKKCRRQRYKKYYKDNRDVILSREAEGRKNNIEQVREKEKKYEKNNKKKIKERKKRYYESNRDWFLEKIRVYGKNNREKTNIRIARYYENNINAHISKVLRSRMYGAIKGGYKSGSAVKDLGCSIEELRLYLEKQFYPNPKTGEKMIWGNWARDGWHIDHIKPLSSFNLTDRKQFLKACHYTNLQPLWHHENYKKGSKINFQKESE